MNNTGNIIELDRATFRDLIKYYQIGTIDYGNKAITIDIKSRRKGSKKYYEVIQKEGNINLECIKDAIEEYEMILNKWGIRPNFELDVELGKITSGVITEIFFFDEGLVRYNELPVSVRWYVESRNKLQKSNNGNTYYDYEYEIITLKCETFPHRRGYTDYTYAYAYELRDTEYLDEGMSFLITTLRIVYGIRTDLIKYCLNGNVLKVWESSPIGVLNRLRFGDLIINEKELISELIIRHLKNIKIDNIFKEVFYTVFPVRGVDFEKARNKAIELARKITNYIETQFGTVSATIKPNTIIIDSMKLRDKTYYAISRYDLGKVVTEVFENIEDLKKELYYSLYEQEIKEIISYVPELELKKIPIMNIREKIKEKLGYYIEPSDLSEDLRANLSRLTNPAYKVSRYDLKEIFKKRAEILQGLRNLL